MARQVEYLEEIQIAIRFRHRCNADHKESVFVHEKTQKGETVWKGYVEVFQLIGHPETWTCYAWPSPKANGVKILTVLASHLIDSPQRAVQAAIFVDAQAALTPGATLPPDWLQQAKQTLKDTQITSEDLNAAIQAARELREIINKRKLKP